MILLLASLAVRSQQLRGVDFSILQASSLDSALLRKNSTLYSARGPYGQENSDEATIFWRWMKDKERYYPVMREAWLFCLNKAPYQLNLYKDGADFYLAMRGATEDSVQRAKYFDALMGVYDLRIERLDSINAHVKRVSDRASKGSLMFRKAAYYDWYVLRPQSPDLKVETETMYPLYKAAIDTIRHAYEEGLENGGDVNLQALEEYYSWACNNYYYTWISVTNDSAGTVVRNNAKSLLVDEYNFIVDFCNQQIEDLAQDYADTLSIGISDSLEAVRKQVLVPYENLKNKCADMLKERANVDLSTRKMGMCKANFEKALEIHKDSLNWLSRLKQACEETEDFSPDNVDYDFYEKVCGYYDKALAKAEASGTVRHRSNAKSEVRELGKNADKYLQLVRYNHTHGTIGPVTLNYAYLAMYYMRQVVNKIPATQKKIQGNMNYIRSVIKDQEFFAGDKRGQTITVDGVTFTVWY